MTNMQEAVTVQVEDPVQSEAQSVSPKDALGSCMRRRSARSDVI